MTYDPSKIPAIHFVPPKEENLSTKNKSAEFMPAPKCSLFGGSTAPVQCSSAPHQHTTFEHMLLDLTVPFEQSQFIFNVENSVSGVNHIKGICWEIHTCCITYVKVDLYVQYVHIYTYICLYIYIYIYIYI